MLSANELACFSSISDAIKEFTYSLNPTLFNDEINILDACDAFASKIVNCLLKKAKKEIGVYSSAADVLAYAKNLLMEIFREVTLRKGLPVLIHDQEQRMAVLNCEVSEDLCVVMEYIPSVFNFSATWKIKAAGVPFAEASDMFYNNSNPCRVWDGKGKLKLHRIN